MNVKVIRSNRKTISIQVNTDLSVTLRAPMHVTQKQIDSIIKEKAGWINKQMEKFSRQIAECGENANEPLSMNEINVLADKAVTYIPQRVSYYAPIVGVTYGRITIRNQKSRWGSCSTKGNLNFNCLLMLTPPEVIDYVVVHELCHRKEMNHSKAFWNEVGKILPDYENAEKWLKEHGNIIMGRQR